MADFTDIAKASGLVDTSGYESDLESTPGRPRRALPCYPSAPRSRRRRDRTKFSPADLARLEAEFAEDPYPDINDRERLANLLSVTEDRIQVWFQNRRSKNRKRGGGRPVAVSLLPEMNSRASAPRGPLPLEPHSRRQALPARTTVTVHGNIIVQDGWPRKVANMGNAGYINRIEERIANEVSPNQDQQGHGPPVAVGRNGFVPRRPWETPSPPSRRLLPVPRLTEDQLLCTSLGIPPTPPGLFLPSLLPPSHLPPSPLYGPPGGYLFPSPGGFPLLPLFSSTVGAFHGYDTPQ